MAYEFCHELTSICDTQLSKREGKRQIGQWMHKVRASKLRCFDSFLTTLENWLDDIANYFIDRHTSGFVEGFNNKLKVIKRRCYRDFARHAFVSKNPAGLLWAFLLCPENHRVMNSGNY